MISPILANVYLHYVFDLWFQKKWRSREVNGDAIIVRYAADLAAALIDRLVHHCHIVNIRGNSYRMKDHQNLLQSGSDRRRKTAAE